MVYEQNGDDRVIIITPDQWVIQDSIPVHSSITVQTRRTWCDTNSRGTKEMKEAEA